MQGSSPLQQGCSTSVEGNAVTSQLRSKAQHSGLAGSCCTHPRPDPDHHAQLNRPFQAAHSCVSWSESDIMPCGPEHVYVGQTQINMLSSWPWLQV